MIKQLLRLCGLALCLLIMACDSATEPGASAKFPYMGQKFYYSGNHLNVDGSEGLALDMSITVLDSGKKIDGHSNVFSFAYEMPSPATMDFDYAANGDLIVRHLSTQSMMLTTQFTWIRLPIVSGEADERTWDTVYVDQDLHQTGTISSKRTGTKTVTINGKQHTITIVQVEADLMSTHTPSGNALKYTFRNEFWYSPDYGFFVYMKDSYTNGAVSLNQYYTNGFIVKLDGLVWQ